MTNDESAARRKRHAAIRREIAVEEAEALEQAAALDIPSFTSAAS